jgi:hypothetical protein
MNNRSERKPENFDWVTARSVCSLLGMFEKLKMQVKSDIDARNALRPQYAHYVFSVVSSGSERFAVVVEGTQIRDSIAFELGKESISASNQQGVIVEFIVTLCDDGECRFKIGTKEYDSWQIRKLVLEEFFFRSR